MGVTTDQPDYSPGSTVQITATFDPLSTVQFTVAHDIGAGADGIWGTADDVLSYDLTGTGLTWTVTAAANGFINTSWFVNQDALGQSFELIATELAADGTATGPMAITSFTDGNQNPVPADVPADLTNGIVFSTGDTTFSTGTGIFPSFVQIQGDNQGGGTSYNNDSDSSTEEGFNTNFRPKVLDTDNSHVHNHALPFAAVPVVIGDGTNGTIDGEHYREFRLDLNDQNGPISLDSLKIYSAATGDLSSLSTATELYNMDGGGDGLTGGLVSDVDVSVGLTAWSSGSGHFDYKVLIPDSYFASANPGDYIYLYSAFSNADAGFEEWSVGPAVNAPSVFIDKVATVYNANNSLDDNNTIDSDTDYIKYTVTITNNGNQDLTGVVVTDSFEGGTGLVLNTTNFPDLTITGDGPQPGTLDIGETWVFTYTHDVTPTEYLNALAGQLGGNFTFDNVATVDTDQTGPLSDPASVGVETGSSPSASLILEKDTVCPDDLPIIHSINGGTILTDADIAWIYTLTDPEAGTHVSNIVLTDNQNGTDFVIYDSAGLHGGATLEGDTNTDGILDSGETWTFTLTGTAVAGTYINVANATGDDVDTGLPVTEADSEQNSYTGVTVADDSIVVVKYVSVDGLADNDPNKVWYDANTAATTPTLLGSAGVDPEYKFTITNNSDVKLTIHLSDSVLSGVDQDVTLDAGGTTDIFATGTWAADLQTNTADVSATFKDSCDNEASPSGSDDANYFGAAPALTIDKNIICDDDGDVLPADTVVNLLKDADGKVQYQIVVTNTGNVAFVDPTVTDSVLTLGSHTDTEVVGGTGTAGDNVLDVGETWTYTVLADWAAGSHTNTAEVVTSYTDSAGNLAPFDLTDSAIYFGADPSIDVTKYVSVDGGAHWIDANTAPGPVLTDDSPFDPMFKFVVHNTGNVALSDIMLDDSVFDLNGGVRTPIR